MRMTEKLRCFGMVTLPFLLAGLTGCGSFFHSCHACPPPTTPAEFIFAANLATGASNLSASRVDSGQRCLDRGSRFAIRRRHFSYLDHH